MIQESITSPTSFIIGRVSDAGRSGKNNEDFADTFPARLRTQHNGAPFEAPIQVAVVADGIGGNVAGETASRMAVDVIKEYFRGNEPTALPTRLVNAVSEANRRIYNRAAAEPALTGMGTTVVAAAIVESRLYVAHAGDSRAYLLRNGQLFRLTLDHTWAQEAVEAGRLTPAQAKDHPNRHVIKRFLGISDQVEVDSEVVDINHGMRDPEQIHTWPRTDSILLQPGDSVILCTDGLTDVVDDDQIATTVSRHAPQMAAQRLIDQANKAGGPDNITVVIVQWSDGTTPVAAGAAKRSPLIAAILAVVLLALAGGAGYVLAGSRGEDQVTVTATTPAAAIGMAMMATTATPAPEEAVAEPTLAPTATPAPPTATALPTATATATATEVPPTSTPIGIQPGQMATDTNSLIDERAAESAGNLIEASDEISSVIVLDNTAIPEVEPTSGASPENGSATSTPIPDFTATATTSPTPTATWTATARAVTATPNVTMTAIPRATINTANTNTLASGNSTEVEKYANYSVVLDTPGDGDTLNSKQSFSWSSNFTLEDGFEYEIIFWKVGQDPMIAGYGYGGRTTQTYKNLSAEDVIEGGAQTGDYLWGLLLVHVEPYTRIKYLGGDRRIRIEAPGKSEGSNGPRR
jgi:serine/threonine protein phosphatase PrpC